MDGESAVLDIGFDAPDSGTETTTPETTTPATPAEPQGETKPQADEYKDDKSYREALKAWRDANKDNPDIVKFAKRAYDMNGRFAELGKLDPKGLDGVRETYALVQQAGGADKIVEMQQQLQTYTDSDARIAAGDPKALESLGPEFDKGLAKLAPAYLDRIQKSDPEGYANAMLPHLLGSLQGSGLLQNLNKVVDVLNNNTLSPEQKLAYAAQFLGSASKWYESESQRAGQLKSAPTSDPQAEQYTQQMTQLEQRERDFLWKTQVAPPVVNYENQQIEKYLSPYQAKLKLPDAAKQDLISGIKSGLKSAGQADKAYLTTLQGFQKNKGAQPDQIIAHVRGGIDRHVARVVKSVTEGRYGHVISSRPGPKPGSAPSTGSAPGTGKGSLQAPLMVSAKPGQDAIDWPGTKRSGDYMKHIYKLKDGRTVQWKR